MAFFSLHKMASPLECWKSPVKNILHQCRSRSHSRRYCRDTKAPKSGTNRNGQTWGTETRFVRGTPAGMGNRSAGVSISGFGEVSPGESCRAVPDLRTSLRFCSNFDRKSMEPSPLCYAVEKYLHTPLATPFYPPAFQPDIELFIASRGGREETVEGKGGAETKRRLVTVVPRTDARENRYATRLANWWNLLTSFADPDPFGC